MESQRLDILFRCYRGRWRQDKVLYGDKLSDCTLLMSMRGIAFVFFASYFFGIDFNFDIT